MRRVWPALVVGLRVLWIMVMLAAVVVLTQQSNAPFVYGGF